MERINRCCAASSGWVLLDSWDLKLGISAHMWQIVPRYAAVKDQNYSIAAFLQVTFSLF